MARRFDPALFEEIRHAFSQGGEAAANSLLDSLSGSFESTEVEAAARCVPEMIRLLLARNGSAALDVIVKASKLQKALPEQMLTSGMYAAISEHRNSEIAWPIFNFAEAAVEEGHYALAMEMIKKVYTVGLSGSGAEFLVNGERLAQVAALLERIAAAESERVPAPPAGTAKSKPRIALVSINMLEGVAAYAKRASQFARVLDRSRFECYEYFTEETLTERPQHALFKFNQEPSEVNAPKALAVMRSSGATVKMVPKELDWLEAARWLAMEMERDSIDGAVFQGGVGSPLMWMASRLTKIPVRMTLCVGVNMFQRGQAATVYMGNRANMSADSAFWRPEWGRQILLDGGVDIEAASEAVPLSREKYKIPSDAVAFGLLSNYPAERATPLYMECVARILKACPKALFVCMGPGKPKAQMDYMASQGLGGRCRWLLWQHQDSFASLKLLDFYCNEFPVGGAQVVLESMACGRPVLAMPWSEKHAECAGAQMLGPDFAIPQRDIEAYVARGVEWAQSQESRAKAADAQFARAKDKFNARAFINSLAELALNLKG